MSNKFDVIVLGAGPCGLGAAVRLHELDKSNYAIIEANSHPGGLASSWRDKHGFLWDIGGHVIFSHYEYFDNVLKRALDEYCTHERESWVRMRDRWIPYPLQNNIHRLPKDELEVCINGIIDVVSSKEEKKKPVNFKEWLENQFGVGLCESFLFPYNKKVWTYNAEKMNVEWMGERVAPINVKRIISNVIHDRDEKSWGPNALFTYPAHDGTGNIWKGIFSRLTCKDKYKLSTHIEKIDFHRRTLTTKSGETFSYEHLISTLPLEVLLKKGNLIESLKQLDEPTNKKNTRITENPSAFISELQNSISQNSFLYSHTHIIGVGMKGSPPPHLKSKAWMYFPEDSSLFYRCTVLSNYADSNAPKGCWSLMFEVAESQDFELLQRIEFDEKLPEIALPKIAADALPEGSSKPIFVSSEELDEKTKKRLMYAVIKGAIRSDLITQDNEIISVDHQKFHYGYPTPYVGRDQNSAAIFEALEYFGVKSRGRFGAWKYEVSNQDHTFMQGVEAVDGIYGSLPFSQELTFYSPNIVNDPKQRSTVKYSK